MNQKRVVAFVFLSLVLFGLVASFASAQAPTPPAGSGSIDPAILSKLAGAVDKLNDKLDELISPGAGSGYGFVKFVVGFIMLLLFSAALMNVQLFQGRAWMAWVISLALVILGMRYIDGRLLESLFYPTAAYILALTLVLQFAVIIFINHSLFGSTGILHRMIWWVWAVALIGLLAVKLVESNNNYDWAAAALYAVAALAASVLGPKIDKMVGKAFSKAEYETAASNLERNTALQQIKRKVEAASAASERQLGWKP